MDLLKHFSHKHSLRYFEFKSRASRKAQSSEADNPANEKTGYKSADEEEEEEEKVRCFACGGGLEGPSYRCRYSCKFYLHKACAELELAPEINHPLHTSHALAFLAKAPYVDREYECDFCGKDCFGFVYHCDECDFDLDVNCALLESTTQNFHKLQHSCHEHPLIFNEKFNKKKDAYCMGCRKELLSGPIYRCLECEFDLHRECAELSLEINHPYHSKHSLTLLPNPPDHSETFSCSFCEKDNWEGFVYFCSICFFGLTLVDVLPPNITTAMNHQHQWTLLSRLMSFICDFCGTDGDRNPHLCTTCNLVVHKKCMSLPHTIKITRHHHPISHIYSLHQKKFESKDCRICYNEVNIEYGCYSCSVSDCNYIAHVNCATHEEIWDGTTLSDEEEAPHESLNLITAVIKEMTEGEVVIATEIKHEYHDHNLILNLSGDQITNGDCCDGCMRLISIPFYSCRECKFFLHKNCAELPRQKQHPSHMHLLTLTNEEYAFCNACHRYHHGFSYKCGKYCEFKIDIQCSLLSDTLSHPSHEHLLFLDYNNHESCSGCPDKNARQAYRCVKRCGFTLDFWCSTLPNVAWYKYDKHPLILTYNNDDFDLNQLYCDICEEERHPNHWFYSCEKCDTSVHTKCVLGALPFIKLESTYMHKSHPHPLTFVNNIWNCPRCNICNRLCYGQALECKESDECNLIIHWNCRRSLKKLSK
ncbi:hypothetical protein REPUB_Repub02eG0188400 [Reevesia pubescens]